MKTLISSTKPPLCISNSQPWKPKSPTFLRPTAPQSLNHSRKPTSTHHRPNANAKGFGRINTTPPAPTIKESADKLGTNRDDEEIPQVVFERMMVRIAVSVGVPLAGGLAALKFFDVVKERHLWDIPMWLPLLTAFFMFSVSALGLAYAALSTSWDAEKRGSFLGLEEVQQNWVEMWREEDESNNM
ncbi:hypothetical protein L484_014227 [Morus notabilis]|uniref:Uncharacterized protein n=1 Tax=Morus notabilis TaxID=981085 RepID=W9RS46_9ROSA|nr:uncharacterized protein PAM68-like [Morus notabilis]EXC05958.1 hypothetical protein L484_014227 [Morus notabilis]